MTTRVVALLTAIVLTQCYCVTIRNDEPATALITKSVDKDDIGVIRFFMLKTFLNEYESAFVATSALSLCVCVRHWQIITKTRRNHLDACLSFHSYNATCVARDPWHRRTHDTA